MRLHYRYSALKLLCKFVEELDLARRFYGSAFDASNSRNSLLGGVTVRDKIEAKHGACSAKPCFAMNRDGAGEHPRRRGGRHRWFGWPDLRAAEGKLEKVFNGFVIPGMSLDLDAAFVCEGFPARSDDWKAVGVGARAELGGVGEDELAKILVAIFFNATERAEAEERKQRANGAFGERGHGRSRKAKE